MQVLPYLCFEGRCEEAIEFYKEVLGAEVCFLLRVGEIPQGPEEGACQGPPNADPQKICHAHLKIGENELLMSDGMSSGQVEFKGITLSVSVADDEKCREVFLALSQGGNVQMDLMNTFFASLWGCCSDKFGVSWMVMSPAPVPAEV